MVAMSNLAARLTSLDERDDVVQDALTRAWQRFETYDASRGSTRAWLLSIVADQAAQRRRRLRVAVRRLGLPKADTVAPTAAAVIRMDIDAAVERLAPRQRLAVDLYYSVGLDLNETAAAMGCAAGTVKSTLADARKRLRLDLEGHDGY
jgi:RNA polymerase sigma factor (sigma-70 family)